MTDRDLVKTLSFATLARQSETKKLLVLLLVLLINFESQKLLFNDTKQDFVNISGHRATQKMSELVLIKNQ